MFHTIGYMWRHVIYKNKNAMGLVYKVTNLKNSKIYIGRTKHSLEYRKNRHFRNAFIKNKINKFYNALRKYGPENFKWETIYDNLDWNKSKEMETLEIIKEGSFYNGYNMTIGGECGPKPSIPEEYEKEIIDLCKNNIHILEISRILKLSSYNIRRYCIKNNIPYIKIKGSVNKINEQDKENIIKLIEKGYHLRKICDTLSLPKGPVNRFIKSININAQDGRKIKKSS